MIRAKAIERDIDWCAALCIDPMEPCPGCKGCTSAPSRDDLCDSTGQVARPIEKILKIYNTRIIDAAVGITKSLGANSHSMHVRMHDARRTAWK